MNKKTLLLVLAVIMSVSCIISFGADAKNPNPTPQQLEKRARIEAKIQDSWEDIITAFNINENEYIKIDYHDMQEIFAYYGEEYGTQLLKNVILPVVVEQPQGSVVPILFAKGHKEILYCYKESDGTNVLKRINIDKNKLDVGTYGKVEEVKREMGRPKNQLIN